MYRVTIERLSSKTTKVDRVDAVMKSEKLYEVIGRFTLLYGPPVMTDNISNIKEAEFFKQVGNTEWLSAEIIFAKVAPDGTEVRKGKVVDMTSNWRRKDIPVVHKPITPPEPNEERIEEMLKAGALEQGYVY